MFLFFGGLPKKTNALGGHKGCVFSFLVLPEKTIGGHRGCVFPFLMLQKNKSNRRAQGSCFCFFLGWASKKNKSNRRAQGLCFLLLWCFHTKKKSNRRAQGLWFCFFWGCKKTNPIGGHKGCVFAFLVLSEKTNPIGGHKGCIFGFCGASKKNKSNTRAEIEGNVCLRETNRAHAGGSHPVPPSGSSGSGAYFIH